jgi:hypothetical protein
VVRLGLIAIALVLLGCGSRQLGIGTTSSGSASESESSESSTESESSESSSDATTTLTTDGVFVPDAPPPPPVPCSPFGQDCAEGEKCNSEGICVPVLGEQSPGEPCEFDPVTGTDDCDETSACWNMVEIEGELLGTCAAACMGSPDNPLCPEGSSCEFSGDGGPYLCVIQCDPLVQDCGLGLGCYWAHGGFNCFHVFPGIPIGEPCGFIHDCAIGLGCLTAEVMPDCQGSACCGPYCNDSLGDGQCEILPGTVCESFFEEGMEPPGYEQVGVCILPQP